MQEISPVLLSGLVGAIVGAVAALASQFLAHHLAEQRERKRFQVQAFERFRREFTEDPGLRRLSEKAEKDLTDEEIDDYAGFFEEIGLYFHRDLVDIELLDEILGDYIIDAWEEPRIREAIGAIRGGEDDPSYFRHFEALARYLVRLKNKRKGADMVDERERRGGKRVLKRSPRR